VRHIVAAENNEICATRVAHKRSSSSACLHAPCPVDTARTRPLSVACRRCRSPAAHTRAHTDETRMYVAAIACLTRRASRVTSRRRLLSDTARRAHCARAHTASLMAQRQTYDQARTGLRLQTQRRRADSARRALGQAGHRLNIIVNVTTQHTPCTRCTRTATLPAAHGAHAGVPGDVDAYPGMHGEHDVRPTVGA
jgi:hypothetical protein